MRITIILFLLGVSASLLKAQEAVVIRLFNPSFEDVPKHSEPPRGWSDCGFPGETPPDVHPTSQFNVLRPAHKGNTYLGMVTRDNDTWESVSQRLPSPILANQCYTFSIYLCRSDTYTSATKADPYSRFKFTNPVKLRIWGSSGYCEKRELLAETEPVKNIEWKQYEFKFEPSANHHYIILEAFYKTPTLFPYNGNLLLDNASDIVPVPCDESIPEAILANLEEQGKAVTRVNKPEKNKEELKKTETKQIIVKEDAPNMDLNRSKLKKGSTFAIENLYFEADSTVIPPACYPILDELYVFMRENKDIIIEIGGHTNSIPKDDYCNKLSLERAQSVAQYLTQKGIPDRQVFYKGYGKTRPIADDSTPEGKKKNQRVEIRILYMKQ